MNEVAISKGLTVELDEINLLLVASRSALTSQNTGTLKSLCEKEGLTPWCTGKRGGSIKQNYVEAILSFVSTLITLHIQASTDLLL